jgi:two-component system, OmpR family, sensor histidine kinase VicK
LVEGDSKNRTDETTEIVYDKENIFRRLLQEIYKTKEKIDICIKITDPFISFTIELVIKAINEIKKDKKIKSSCIIEITKENADYFNQLLSTVDEVRYLDEIKASFLINETTYAGISIVQQITRPIPQLMISDVKSFVEQQQFYFDLLWNKSIPANQKIKEMEEGGKEIPNSPVIKTEVLHKQQEILKRLVAFYKNSYEIGFCSYVESIKLIYNDFYNLHKEILERYRNGNHKGIRWITSINDKKDIELVKTFMDKGIEIRHVKDLLAGNFALSDKAFLFTIENMEEGKMVTSILSSNDKLYLNHYKTVFENLWKHGIDVKDRIKDIEEGHYINVELIPNSRVSLKFAKELVDCSKYEISMILASASTFFRIENNIGFKGFEELAYNGIKVKILIPLGIELLDEINRLKVKYPKIEFRILHSDIESFIGITIIDREKVLLFEIKDDTKSNYVDSVGMTIFVEGKSTALSYTSIFDSLWKQTDLYNELKNAYERIQSHDRMQKEFIDIAAHELRTPLQPMIGITTILKNEIQSERHKEFLEILIRNIQRLKTLSEDILDVTKIESNSLYLNKEHFKIKELILKIIENYKNEAAAKNIKFEYIFADDDDDDVIYADKNRIIQAISNFICNSIKFISKEKEDKGIITISVKRRKSDNCNFDINSKNIVVVTIKDNGAGIDEEILPKLFTKFVSKSFQGTGLGLYISKNIVEAHGGEIWAKNNGDGKGATFGFSLPIVN